MGTSTENLRRILIPPVRSGDWEVSVRTRASTEYTSLRNVAEDVEYMTDLPHEWEQHEAAVKEASGSKGGILVTGLGLGMFCRMILERESTARITVVEKARDVIRMVAPTLSNQITIICADAMRYQPRESFAFAWHDIWPNKPTRDQYRQVKLNYQAFCDTQRCWLETE